MNIFYLDEDPIEAARFHCDKHVVKMIIESAQLLSNVFHVLQPSMVAKSPIYKKTHLNHPSSMWVRESERNFEWLVELFGALCDEYSSRFGKTHATEKKLRDFFENCPSPYGPFKGRWSQPPLCMPDKYKCESRVESYRAYYRGEKKHIAAWRSPSRVPYWWEVV